MTKDQRSWNAIALIFFLCLCAISVLLITRYANTVPAQLGFFDLAILGLATFRLLHLLTYDKIFDPVRTSFMVGRGNRIQKAPRGWRRLMCEFLECLWCTGLWSGLFVVTIYFLGTWGRFAALVLAVAGLGSLLQLVSKAVAETSR